MKSQFNRTEKSLLKLLEEQSTKEQIDRRFDEISQRWQEVQDAHDVYMTKVPEENKEKRKSGLRREKSGLKQYSERQ